MPDASAIRSVSIIGAGLMGRSIAAANLAHRLPVTLCDVSPQALDDAVGFLRAEFPTGVIHTSSSAADSAAADLVIEAVAEKPGVKRRVFSGLGPHLGRNTIVASNTSSIPLARLCDSVSAPERFCGLHFCHPVAERRLVEIVRGRATNDATLSIVSQYVHTLGKQSIVVEDAPGFVVNRLLFFYLNEALELLRDGAAIEEIEAAAVEYGMPWGPFTQLDEFGIDVALQAGSILVAAFPDRVVASPLLIDLYQAGRLGKKTGQGFFSHDDAGGRSASDDELPAIIAEHRRDPAALTREDLTRRLFLPMLLEATRIIEQGLVAKREDVDVALSGGLAFSPPGGGLLAWADAVGAARLLEWIAAFEHLGPRFQPTDLLRDLARTGRRLLPASPHRSA